MSLSQEVSTDSARSQRKIIAATHGFFLIAAIKKWLNAAFSSLVLACNLGAENC
jgi:hypothetical protein